MGKRYKFGRINKGKSLNTTLFASFGGQKAIKARIAAQKSRGNKSTPPTTSTSTNKVSSGVKKHKGYIFRTVRYCENIVFRMICNDEQFGRYMNNRNVFLSNSRFSLLRAYDKLTWALR
jgi:hypothetical protein